MARVVFHADIYERIADCILDGGFIGIYDAIVQRMLEHTYTMINNHVLVGLSEYGYPRIDVEQFLEAGPSIRRTNRYSAALGLLEVVSFEPNSIGNNTIGITRFFDVVLKFSGRDVSHDFDHEGSRGGNSWNKKITVTFFDAHKAQNLVSALNKLIYA